MEDADVVYDDSQLPFDNEEATAEMPWIGRDRTSCPGGDDALRAAPGSHQLRHANAEHGGQVTLGPPGLLR